MVSTKTQVLKSGLPAGLGWGEDIATGKHLRRHTLLKNGKDFNDIIKSIWSFKISQVKWVSLTAIVLCCLFVCLFFSGAEVILARPLKTVTKPFIRHKSIECNVVNIIFVE